MARQVGLAAAICCVEADGWWPKAIMPTRRGAARRHLIGDRLRPKTFGFRIDDLDRVAAIARITGDQRHHSGGSTAVNSSPSS